MKLIFKLLFICALLVSSLLGSGQDYLDTTGYARSPFGKGNWHFQVERIAGYESFTDRENDVKIGEHSDARFDLFAMYFIMSGLGLGLDYQSDWACEGNYSNKAWSLTPTVMYGMNIGQKNHLYGRIGYGFGNETSITRIPGNDNNLENKWDVSKLSIGIGSPINLNTGTTYLTPELSWRRTTLDYGNSEEIESKFMIGLKLQSFLEPRQFSCDNKLNYNTIHQRYDQGSNYIDFTTMGGYRFGSIEDKGPTSSSEDDFSGGNLKVKYGHYIVDNVAIGAGLGFRSNTQKPANSDNKFSTFNWSISPELTFNLPAKNAWNNLFLDLEGEYGATKIKNKVGTNTNTTEYTDLGYGVCLGYNKMFTKDLALTPSFGYNWNTQKEKGTDEKIKSRGIDFSLGIRYIF